MWEVRHSTYLTVYRIQILTMFLTFPAQSFFLAFTWEGLCFSGEVDTRMRAFPVLCHDAQLHQCKTALKPPWHLSQSKASAAGSWVKKWHSGFIVVKNIFFIISVRNSLFKVYSTLFENSVICVISVQSRSELVYKAGSVWRVQERQWKSRWTQLYFFQRWNWKFCWNGVWVRALSAGSHKCFGK